jgi:hypothetical protein
MDLIIREVATLFGAGTLFAIVLGWLLKTYLLEGLQRERDSLSTQLKQQADVSLETIRRESSREIETLKQQLDIQREQEKLRFSKIHEKRAELASALYAKLFHAYTAATFPGVLLHGASITENEIDAILKASSDAISMFDENRLFFPKRLEEAIQAITSAITKPAYVYYGSSSMNPDEMRAWINEFPAEDVRHKLENLASEFRQLLGVEG